MTNAEEDRFDIDVDVDGADSDGDSDSSCADRSPRKGKNSQSPWPQSYRQSMDMYMSASANSPTLGFLSNSYIASSITSSFRKESLQDILPDSLKQALLPAKGHKEEEKEKDYNHAQLSNVPSKKDIHAGCETSHQCGFGQALLNGMNMLCGVGILSTPYAVKEGGWLGLCVLFAFALLSCYTGVLLRYCMESRKGIETYPDIGQAAFGTKGRIIVSIILYVELYACCVGYILLESDNLSSLFPYAHLHLGGSGIHLNSHQLFAIVTALSVLPTVWLRDLSLLSYISAGGVVASILVFLSLLWLGIVDEAGLNHKGTMLDLSSLPIAIGLYGYCYSGHAVYPNIYTSMKNRSQFNAVLIICFMMCTIMYAGSAVLGYMMFGEAIESQFTLNMPQKFVASKLALWTTVVNPFAKYALTITPVALSLEELLPSTTANSIIVRTALVISTVVVALAVPFFGLVMSLIGSLLSMLVVMILPSIFFLRLIGNQVTWSQVILCVAIIILGIVCSAIGTYSSTAEIVDSLYQ